MASLEVRCRLAKQRLVGLVAGVLLLIRGVVLDLLLNHLPYQGGLSVFECDGNLAPAPFGASLGKHFFDLFHAAASMLSFHKPLTTRFTRTSMYRGRNLQFKTPWFSIPTKSQTGRSRWILY